VRKAIWEIITTVVPALVMALAINVYVAEAASIEDGPSMQPNLHVGYRMMMEKLSYRFGPIERGDVVVVDREGGLPLIKRVIGLPGETVEVRGGRVWIDGEHLDEPWGPFRGGPDYPPVQVPADHLYIIGDNRPNSLDSRIIGPVPVEAVQGHVVLVYWPPSAIQLLP
jgi:signal peptidase I